MSHREPPPLLLYLLLNQVSVLLRQFMQLVQGKRFLQSFLPRSTHARIVSEKTVIEIDKALSMLNDGHTRFQSKDRPKNMFLVDLVWDADSLFLFADQTRRRIIKINRIEIASILVEYREAYGFSDRIIKNQIISDIKTASAVFKGELLEIQLADGERLIKDLHSKEKIIESIPNDIRSLMKLYKTFFANKTGETIYLRVASFFEKMMPQAVKVQLNNLLSSGKTDTVIIDLRDNIGGYIQTAIDLAALFVEKTDNLDFDVLDRSGNRAAIQIVGAQLPGLTGKKIIVFVNKNTQSVAEYIFPHALTINNQKPLFVGEKTAGLSGQAKQWTFDSHYLLSVTTKRYLLHDSMKSVEFGVIPDVNISTNNLNSDPYLQWYKENYERRRQYGKIT